MSNRIDAALAGMASLEEVGENWADQFPDAPAIRSDIRKAWGAMATIMSNNFTRNAAMSIAAAALNSQIAISGNVVSVRSNGDWNVKYYSNDDERKAMQGLMNS